MTLKLLDFGAIENGQLFTLDADEYFVMSVNIGSKNAKLMITNDFDDLQPDYSDSLRLTVFLIFPRFCFFSVQNVEALHKAVEDCCRHFKSDTSEWFRFVFVSDNEKLCSKTTTHITHDPMFFTRACKAFKQEM